MYCWRRGRSEPLWSGVERPCSVGIRSERVEALGAADRPTWTPVGGLADETRRAERARQALRYIPRSLVSAPAVHHSVSRWRRSAAGWGAASICSVATQMSACPLERVYYWKHKEDDKGGSKLFRRKFTPALTLCDSPPSIVLTGTLHRDRAGLPAMVVVLRQGDREAVAHRCGRYCELNPVELQS